MTTYTTPTQTVRDRLSLGPISAADGLRYALILGESLRRLHDAGHAHGAVSPANIAITPSGVDLLPAHDAPGAVTAYTAPEVIAGQVPDARSDIFSFGAVVYEMLTGRRVFEGENASALAWAIGNASPAPSGSPAVDKLVGACLVKDPGGRCQRIQKVLMELKLLTVAVRRSEATPGKRDGQVEAALQQMEARLRARYDARIELQEAAMTEVRRAAGEAIEALRGQLDSLSGQISDVRERASEAIEVLRGHIDSVNGELVPAHQRAGEAIEGLRGEIDAITGHLVSTQQRVGAAEQAVQAVGDRVAARVEESLAASVRRVDDVEQGAEATRQRTAAFQESVTSELNALQQAVKAQTLTIESARTAMAQTDDLVERVVEALESLQSTVLEQSEERSLAIN